MPFELEVSFGRRLPPKKGWNHSLQLNGYLAVEFLHKIGILNDKENLMKPNAFEKVVDKVEEFRQEAPSMLKYDFKLKSE